MKDQALFYAFFVSSLIHMLAIPTLSSLMRDPPLRPRQDLISVELMPLLGQQETKAPEASPKPPSPRRTETKVPEPLPQRVPLPQEIPKAEDLEPKKNKPERAAAPSSQPEEGEDVQSLVSGTPGKGSGAGNLFGGDVAVVPGGGLGKSGTGRGEEPAGSRTGERGSRQAKPIQTAKATYPPMALRMGLEGDVTLRIEVDTEGKVTKAEIIKSASTAFDEEALKAVRQFRFEPARKDAKNVPSEFTYIYRFRLEK